MATYKIGDLICDTDAEGAQALLAVAHVKHQRPLCLCATPHPEMYIAHVDGTYLVKRMPNSALKHHPDCASFEPPPGLSGLADVSGNAIKPDPDDPSATLLRLDFALTATNRKAPPPSEGGDPSSVKANPAKLSLRGLLHFLWDEAGLTRWTPGMAGKRSWPLVRHLLLAAAARSHTASTDLSRILLVPELFTMERKDEVELATRSFLHGLKKGAGKGQPLGILVGELKSREPGNYGMKFYFKHLRHMPIFADEETAARFERVNEQLLALTDLVPASRLMAIATFSRSATGYSDLREIATMAVTENWLPFEHGRDADLLEALTRGQRSYRKMLRYNRASEAPLPSVLLTDTRPEPVALFAPPEGFPEARRDVLTAAIEASPYPSWTWDATDVAMPELPARPMTTPARSGAN